MRIAASVLFLSLSAGVFAAEAEPASPMTRLSDEEARTFPVDITVPSCADIQLEQDSDNASERTAHEIYECIKRVVPLLEFSYKQALFVNPALQGTVMVRMAIDPDGSVARIESLDSDISNAAFIETVVKRLGSLRWRERQVAPASVVLPMVFRPSTQMEHEGAHPDHTY